MKLKIFITVLFAAIALIHMTSYTPIQVPDGPHGGTIKKSGNFFIEMKNPYERMYAYLFDRGMKPVSNKSVICNVRFYYNDSTSTDMKLEPFEEEGFVSASTVPDYATCKIMFNVGENIIEAKFDNSAFLVKTKK